MFKFDSGFLAFGLILFLVTGLRFFTLNAQMKSMQQKIAECKRQYPYLGQGHGKKRMLRVWVLVCADEEMRITHCERLAGLTMFARYKPYTALNTIDVEFVANGGQLPVEVDTRTAIAAQGACKQIMKRLNEEGLTDV